jgi:hypothetical protein
MLASRFPGGWGFSDKTVYEDDDDEEAVEPPAGVTF